MEILSKEQLRGLLFKVYDNRKVIAFLDPQQTVELIYMSENELDGRDHDSILYKGFSSLKQDLEQHLTKKPQPLSTEEAPKPIHYAIYHRINELYCNSKSFLADETKGPISQFAEEHYNIKGVNFYNEYNNFRKKNLYITAYLHSKTRKQLNKIQECTFEIARLFNNQEYIDWWNKAFPKKV